MQNQSKRDRLLKEALCLLFDSQWKADAERLEFYCDDEVIALYQRKIQELIDAANDERITRVAKELESDPEAIGLNGTLAHALAVEITGQHFAVGDAQNVQ